MTDSDAERLADIRAQNAQWLALNPEAVSWDATFLLQLLDEAKLGRITNDQSK